MVDINKRLTKKEALNLLKTVSLRSLELLLMRKRDNSTLKG